MSTHFKEPEPGEFEALLFWNDQVKKKQIRNELSNPNPNVFVVKKCASCGRDTLVPKTFKGSKPKCEICRGVEKPRHVNSTGGFPIGATINGK